MRLPLDPTPSFLYSLSHPPSASDPPLVFIDQEPFLVELQGSLEMPGGGHEGGEEEMRGVEVGKIDLSEPVRRAPDHAELARQRGIEDASCELTRLHPCLSHCNVSISSLSEETYPSYLPPSARR